MLILVKLFQGIMDPMALLQALAPKAAAAAAAAPASQRQVMLKTRLSKSFKTFGGDPVGGRPITRSVKQWCMTDTSLELDTALLSDLNSRGLDQVIPSICLYVGRFVYVCS